MEHDYYSPNQLTIVRDAIKNLLRGLMSVCVVIPENPSESVYRNNADRMEDLNNLRADFSRIRKDFETASSKASRHFYVR